MQQAGNHWAALQLLDKLMTEWPDEAQKAAVFHQQAECLENLGNREAALDAYRLVFQAQRELPSYKTSAHLGFGLLVAVSPLPELYAEALSVLEEFESSSFPIEEFTSAAIRALIAEEMGQHEKAVSQAQVGLEAAGRTHSGYARHANLGLVTDRRAGLVERLTRIVQRIT